MQMSKEEIIKALNIGLSRELGAITQYFWHSVMAKGIESPAIRDMLREFSIEEMKHAESLAERINYLGGVPTTKPTEIKVGGDLKKMISDDYQLEIEAIELYKGQIKLCQKEEDPVTRRMLESILADEEKHADELGALLEK